MFSVHISLYIKYCGPGPIIFEQSFAAVAEASLIRIFQQLCAEFPYYNNLPTYLLTIPSAYSARYLHKKGFFFGPVCSQAHADPHPPFWGWLGMMGVANPPITGADDKRALLLNTVPSSTHC